MLLLDLKLDLFKSNTKFLSKMLKIDEKGKLYAEVEGVKHEVYAMCDVLENRECFFKKVKQVTTSANQRTTATYYQLVHGCVIFKLKPYTLNYDDEDDNIFDVSDEVLEMFCIIVPDQTITIGQKGIAGRFYEGKIGEEMKKSENIRFHSLA